MPLINRWEIAIPQTTATPIDAHAAPALPIYTEAGLAVTVEHGL